MWQTDNAYVMLRELKALDNPPEDEFVSAGEEFLNELNNSGIMPEPDSIYYSSVFGYGNNIVFHWTSETNGKDIEIWLDEYDYYPELHLINKVKEND